MALRKATIYTVTAALLSLAVSFGDVSGREGQGQANASSGKTGCATDCAAKAKQKPCGATPAAVAAKSGCTCPRAAGSGSADPCSAGCKKGCSGACAKKGGQEVAKTKIAEPVQDSPKEIAEKR